MLLSLRYLGFSWGASLAGALIPLILGAMGVLASLAYTLTALCVIVACVSAILPEMKIDKLTPAIALARYGITSAKAQ
ncbi:MAG: hypothetical protein ACJ8HI_04445 [Massilia sp.]